MSAAVTDPGRRFRQDILTRFFVRTHMSLIVSGTVSSGLLATTLIYLLGVRSTAVRYPLAVLVSYLGFFGFVRLWIAYVLTSRSTSSSSSEPDLGAFDAIHGGGSSGGSTFSGGGGSSGGAGASGQWDGSEVSDTLSSSGHDIDLPSDIDVHVDVDVDVDLG